MTEEEFIKNYFNKKNSINEGTALDSAVELGSQFLSGVDPFTKMLISGIKYGLSKGTSDVLDKKKGFFDFLDKNKKVKASKPKDKDEEKKRNDKLKLRGMILNNGNLYLKYFLITFTLDRIEEKKPKLDKNQIPSIYTEIENNKYICPITKESFKQSVIITSNAKINGKKINEDFFYKMLNEIFIENPNKSRSLYEIINLVLETTTIINQTNINSIFSQFYSKENINYKIG
jgi:hypothetical protein